MKTLNFNSILLVIITASFISLVFFVLFYIPMRDKIKTLQKSKTYYDTTYLQKQGGTSVYPGAKNFPGGVVNYNLRSWDGGKTWYETKYSFSDKTLKVIGEAEIVYPGLLNHLEASERLTNYVKKGGPIDIDDPVGHMLLKDAGFTVVKNHN